ncbi:MAG TPA: hypothetical protein VG603_12450 [Chitinophagales bacterium]|nr:hypothetical protein [Chitinophagales bacterium]
MKRTGILLLLIAGVVLRVAAQGGVIISWSGGYAGAPAIQGITVPLYSPQAPAVDNFGTLANLSDADGSYKAVKSTYGYGFNFSLHGGYMFNRFLGIELAASYMKSKSFSATQVQSFYFPDSSGQLANTGDYVSNVITTQSQGVFLTPALIASYSKPGMKVYPYLCAGVVLPVWVQLQQSMSMTLEGFSGNTQGLGGPPYFMGAQTDASYDTKTKFSAGITGALGVAWQPYQFICVFAELNGQFLNLKPKSTTITSWIADENDFLGLRSTYRSQFVYVKQLSSSSNNESVNANYDVNKAKEVKTFNIPYSNIGFNIGVQLFLNTKIFKDKDAFEETRPRKKKPQKKEDAN